MPKIYKAKDSSDKLTIKKDNLFDLPFRMLITASSGQGKSNFLFNLILNDELGYGKIFKNNIHIFSPTPYSDNKLNTIIEEMDVDPNNIYDELDDNIDGLYDELVQQYKESISDDEQPEHKLIIIDDFGFKGSMAKNRFNSVSKIFCNGRKFLVSIVVLVQRYSQATPNIRANISAGIIFNTNLKELNLIESENNYLDSTKDFISMFRKNVTEKHDFLIVNYSNDYKNLYMDSNFNSLV